MMWRPRASPALFIFVIRSNLLLSLHLLLQVLALDEVSQLGVSVGVSNFVHLEQRLMNFLLQLQRGFDGTQCRDPVISLGLCNILEDNASTSHVLVLDELHGMVALFFRVGLEPLGKARKGNII